MDIYTGTLTRYYSANWKTALQQWCEERKVEYQRHPPQNKDIMSLAEIQETVESWRNDILSVLANNFDGNFPVWIEDNIQPYYTDRMGWTAYEALRLFTACKTYGEPLPQKFLTENKLDDFEIAKRVNEDKNRNWSLYLGVTCWLPLDTPFVIKTDMPTNKEAILSSTGCLLKDLEAVNALYWNADDTTISKWSETEGYLGEAPKKHLLGKFQATIPPRNGYDTESLAKYAFSVFYKAVKFSKENNVPILMDF